MTWTGSSHIAPNSAARCDIDLSPGARRVPERAGRLETTVHAAPGRIVERRDVARRRDEPQRDDTRQCGLGRRLAVGRRRHRAQVRRRASPTSELVASHVMPARPPGRGRGRAARPARPRRRRGSRARRCRASRTRVEAHVDDVDRRTPERERDLRHDPRAVRDLHAQLEHLAAGEVGLQQPPAVLARGVVPGARCRRRRPPASWSRTRTRRATRSSIAATSASALAR